MKKKSIIFMGTPEFAVPSLKILINKDFNIIGVITATDKKSGRGRKITSSPIKKIAESNNITLFQPKSLKDPNFLNELSSLNPDLFVVVAFRMLPEILINIPKLGTINLHSSLLPDYRGAAPINWVIINGEKETGVTTFFINKKIDEGDVIDSVRVKINDGYSAGILHDKLMSVGAKLVLKTVNNIFTNTFSRQKQIISDKDKLAPKIDKELCKINLKKSSKEIVRLIKGLSPYPCAKLKFNNKYYKIIDCKKTDVNYSNKSTMFVENNKLYFKNFKNESIEILELQAEGKKIMKSSDFLRGNKL
ncbi:MAG: methionyl-tRNA formyltransferase [Cytophagales bacterium]|nr:MAG: methionyl-tRNA formyltransferase [Rhodothermaeota bacterium MED-G16]